jgi:hypothetical protein
METVLLVQTGSTACPDGACRSHSIRPSHPGKQVARFNQPEGPGIFPPGSKAIGSTVPLGMLFANRLCPDENLLRQNVSI